MKWAVWPVLLLVISCSTTRPLHLNYDTHVDPELQGRLVGIDSSLRATLGMPEEATNVGLLDLKTGRVAMIHPDKTEYAASVPKIAILLAWFELHQNEPLDPTTKHELSLMARSSSNEMATRFSRAIGMSEVQGILNSYGFYDQSRGGGIWFGKHYGPDSERIGDPVADHSHAASVRQLLRFWLMLDRGELVSPAASKTMREIFASPDIPHDNIKFVRGLAGRDVDIIRKWGSWKDWLHDSALITGPGRRYVLVALTHHPRGDEYLEQLARLVDDLLIR